MKAAWQEALSQWGGAASPQDYPASQASSPTSVSIPLGAWGRQEYTKLVSGFVSTAAVPLMCFLIGSTRAKLSLVPAQHGTWQHLPSTLTSVFFQTWELHAPLFEHAPNYPNQLSKQHSAHPFSSTLCQIE